MELTIEIIDYQEDAMFDDFADGTSEQYDVATVKILSGSLIGNTYHVCVAADSPDAALWRQTGHELSAEVEPEDLRDLDVIFSGAFVLKEGKR